MNLPILKEKVMQETSKQNANLFAAFTEGRRRVVRLLFDDANEAMPRVNERFKQPVIDEARIYKFKAGVKLENDEWTYLDLDDEDIKGMIHPYLENVRNTVKNVIVGPDDYRKIDVIYKNINEDSAIFYKITNSLRLENRGLLLLGNTHPTLQTYEQAIDFSGRVDAYYVKKRLYFKNYSTIRPLFPGIEKYFRSATRAEQNKFLGNDFFDVQDADMVIGIRAAKHIATILDDSRIKLNDKETQEKIKQYALKYEEAGVAFNDEGKIKIGKSKDLNNVLSLLSGRYYTSEITGDKMEAREVQKL